MPRLNTATTPARPLPRMLMLMLALLVSAVVVTIPDDEAVSTSGASLPHRQATELRALSLPDLGGGQWALSAQTGHIVVLNFWATWCPACREETPYLIALSSRYRSRGVDVVGVAMESGSPDNVRAFVSKNRIPYRVLSVDANSFLYGFVSEYPTTIVVDEQGRVVGRYVGALDQSDFQRTLDGLLKSTSAPHAPAPTNRLMPHSLI